MNSLHQLGQTIKIFSYQTFPRYPISKIISFKQKRSYQQDYEQLLLSSKHFSNSQNSPNMQLERRQLINNVKWPYLCMGVVKSRINIGQHSMINTGTGTLIGQNLVLTCAHTVFEKESKLLATNIQFLLCPNGDQCRGKFRVTDVIFPPQYQKTFSSIDDYKHDWAILILDLNGQMLNDIGYLGIKPDYHQTELEVQINGFPREKRMCNNGYYVMYGMKGRINIKDNLIRYNLIQTSEGQSGSVILDANNSIIGVHVLENHAIYLTSNILKYVNQMLVQKNAQDKLF